MKRTLLLFVVLLVSVWIGININKDPGYVLVAIQQWTIETPLWFAVVIILLFYALLHFFLRLLNAIRQAGSIFQYWQIKRLHRKAHKHTNRGLIEFSEGNWQQAEQQLVKALPSNESPLINYLAAAKAAQEQGDSERRDQYLRQAQKNVPDAHIAIELTQAQLQIANEQWEQALASLQHLRSLSPKHPFVLKLLIKLYRNVGDWQSLEKVLPQVKRTKILKPEQYHKLETKVYLGLINKAYSNHDGKHLRCVWETFPKYMTKQSEVVAHYVRHLIDAKEYTVAEQCLRVALKSCLDDELVTLYGLTPGEEPKKQLHFVEGLLREHPQNPYLLLSAARICVHNKLWGKARSYLENSVELLPQLDAYAELAQLLEQLQEKEAANGFYKLAVEQAIKEKNRFS